MKNIISLLSLVAVICVATYVTNASADVLCSLRSKIIILKRTNKCPAGYQIISTATIADYKKAQQKQLSISNVGRITGAIGAQGHQGVKGEDAFMDPKRCYTKKPSIPLKNYPVVNVDSKTRMTYFGTTQQIISVALKCDSPSDVVVYRNFDTYLNLTVKNDKILSSENSNLACSGSSDGSTQICNEQFSNGHEFYIWIFANTLSPSGSLEPTPSLGGEGLSISCCQGPGLA